MKLTLALLATLLSVGLVRAMEQKPMQQAAIKVSSHTYYCRNRGPRYLFDDRDRSRSPRRDQQQQQQQEQQQQQQEQQQHAEPTFSEPCTDASEHRVSIADFMDQVKAKVLELLKPALAELESRLPAGAKDTFKEFRNTLQTPDFHKDPRVVESIMIKFNEIGQDPAVEEAFNKFVDTPAFRQFMEATSLQIAATFVQDMADTVLPPGPVDQAASNRPTVVFMFGPPQLHSESMPGEVLPWEIQYEQECGGDSATNIVAVRPLRCGNLLLKAIEEHKRKHKKEEAQEAHNVAAEVEAPMSEVLMTD